MHLQKDDGTAPLPFPYHQQLSVKVRSKRMRRFLCCCCCRRRRKKDQDDTALLRSYSERGGFTVRNQSANDMESTSENDVSADCFGGEQFDPFSITVMVRSLNQSRRIRIPNRPDVSMSLWSLIKNAIGKDLTKLPLPVNFNEPLSMLQRLNEDYEYSALIDKAADTSDPFEQMAYIAAYTVSSYATSALRTGKPFNPLLGETFESDRIEDLGWRCISEQVSHHPPLVAQHCQGRKWVCWQQFSMSSRFRGNSIEITPLGLAHLLFPKTGTHYTWRKVPSIVHNIMFGKLWIDQEGEMDIYNHSTGEICHIKYNPSSFFKGEAKRVEGTIYDSVKQPKLCIAGTWDSKIESFEILKIDSKGSFTLGPAKLLWSRVMPPSDSDKYYNFTLLACQLNEMEEGVAPTDSRNRPDQRLMENGYFDEANLEKLRIEEKQRTARKIRLQNMTNSSKSKSTLVTAVSKPPDDLDDDGGEPGYKPAWFSVAKDQVTGKNMHIYNGEYWECKNKSDWSRCPDIF
ncbi:oxysterol-binding protein 1 [Folsomia candida]|uniref:oxysterol-binding protein 1 n=1 Tax=Folsomia candida TaxID=158441 RepID=UPI00160556FE|nr:oxysterol-binding protein 1 [Folsomia candida]